MNKYLWIVVVLVLTAAASAALAQQEPGQAQGSRNGQGKTFAPENFQDLKTRVLQILEERRTRLEQEKACVEKTENMQDLQKCRPEPQRGHGGREGQGGPREQRSPASPRGQEK